MTKNEHDLLVDLEHLQNRIKALEEELQNQKKINQEHQKLNGELQQKLTKIENHYNCRLFDIDMYKNRVAELEEIINGKAIQELGVSKLYESNELREQIEEAKKRGWNDITVEVDKIEKLL